jgi:hypothetical protein
MLATLHRSESEHEPTATAARALTGEQAHTSCARPAAI